MNEKIYEQCKNFRVNELKITRRQMSIKTGLTVNQIFHFENGRSTNMFVLLAYIKLGMRLGGVYNG